MEPGEEFKPLMDAIFRDKVRWARMESPERKFMDGLELFEIALERMRGGVRSEFPAYTQEEVEAEVNRRIRRIRQIEDYGFYRSTEAA